MIIYFTYGLKKLTDKKPIIIAVLGPDRVGKTTFISNSKDRVLTDHPNLHPNTLHFAGPKQEHNNPIEQYTQPLDFIVNNFNSTNIARQHIIFCDRGFSEVCFYDKVRRNIITSDQWAVAAESYFKQSSDSLSILLIERSWEWSKPFHKKEIDDLYPNATRYYKYCQLLNRENEHRQYYEYMKNYLNKVSTLPYKSISPEINESVFDYNVV